jgi:hypothetical protein
MSNKVALHLGPLRDSGTRDSPDKIAASFSQCTSLPSTSSSFPNHSHFSQSLSQLLHINAFSTMSIMLDALVRCRTPGCNRLIEDAVPLPQSSRARLPNSKAHKHCSLSCARRDLSLRVTCQAEDCAALVRNIIPDIPGIGVPSYDFDTTRYCLGICAGHAICDVCAVPKPFIEYISDNDYYAMIVPIDCHRHVACSLFGSNRGVCIECITAHLTIRFRDRGINGLNCVAQGCSH